MTTKTPEALAVLDRAISNVLLVSPESVAWANELRKARAAFAELLASDHAFDEAIATYGISSRWAINTDVRRKNALAAVEELK